MSRIVSMLLLLLGFQPVFAADLPITDEPSQTITASQEKTLPLGLDVIAKNANCSPDATQWKPGRRSRITFHFIRATSHRH